MNPPIPPLRHTAYLVAYLGAPKDYQGLMPVVTSVGIYSSSARNLTCSHEDLPVDILQVDGNSVQDAIDNMKATIKTIPSLAWADIWLSMEDTSQGWMSLRKMAKDHERNVSK